MCLVPICVFGWLVMQEMVLSGVYHVSYAAGQHSAYIDPLLPDGRVTGPQKNTQGDTVQIMTGDPVSFFVHPHRSFENMVVKLWYKNTGAPAIEFGGLAVKDPDRYALTPLQNKQIDASTWSRTEENGYTLLQRKPTFTSVADFLKRPPAFERIATYHASMETPFRLVGYEPNPAFTTTQVSLRGRTEMKTYVKNEPIQFSFSFMDMNRDEGSDAISISVFDEQGRAVGGAQADDDGNRSKNAFPSLLRHVDVTVPNVPEGVYKIVFDASRDIFVRSITTSQQKLIFLNAIYFGDEVGYHETFTPVSFWTQSKQLSFMTRQASGLQSLAVGSKSLSLIKPYELYTAMIADPGLVRTDISKGDVEVITNDPVSVHKEQYFHPDPIRLFPETNLDALGVDYVFAHYTPPQQEGDWFVSMVSVDAKTLLFDRGSWKFGFSLPDIARDQGRVEVKQMDFTFYRKPFVWRDLASLFE